MDLDERPAYAHRRTDGPGAGCLTVAVRIPVRVVVLLLVLPVRLVWDALVATARGLDRIALRPLGRACAWLYTSVLTPVARGLARAVGGPATAVWQWVVVPVVRYGAVVPAVWIHRYLLTPLGQGIRRLHETLLTPLGRGLGVAVVWLGRALLVWPCATLWRYVVVPVAVHGVARPLRWAYRRLLTPLGRGCAGLLTVLGRGGVRLLTALAYGGVRLLMLLVVTPVTWGYRRILAPVGREVRAAFAVAWRVAGYLSRAFWRALGLVAWQLVGRPARWTYRRVCTPLGHWTRDRVWAPARAAGAVAGRAARDALRWTAETVRGARRDVWGALTGVPEGPWPVEPPEHRARTLGSTTIVPGVAPVPETSPHSVGRVRDPG
ncbi:hypothetical protein ACFXP3_27685 [Streptomyces sp. NPDC059096]|uniref:hypothetical protein n=1 Tax=Streptomyces sp. NPDC059096 TaxID=3346727 RepID=UPI0036880193